MDDAEYLAKLRSYWKRHQTFPSMGKLCDVVGLSSTSSVFELVRRLRQQQVNAQITIIEFADYQCPYCARHFTDTMPEIEREFVATGKLMVVASEFPLERMHPLALKAAQAARCAGEQGKFWEMHARLFRNQRRLEPWTAHAEALALDEPRFDACLSAAKDTDEIRRNVQEALKAGVNSTPTFLLALNTPEGLKVIRRVRGAAPFAAFKAEIEALTKGE